MPDEILTAAVEIARTAGAVAAERFRTGSPISRKADGTEVTSADVEVERLIRRLVGQRFPGDQVYGEEDERPERLAVTARTRLRGAAVGLHNPSTWSEQLLATLHREVALMSWASAGTGVVSGWIDAGVIAGHPMGYQDMAPLPVLVTEAGGRVTDLAGGDVLAGAGDVLTSNGQLHDQLVDLVAGLPTGPRPHP
jgi:histidinol-phosphatase